MASLGASRNSSASENSECAAVEAALNAAVTASDGDVLMV